MELELQLGPGGRGGVAELASGAGARRVGVPGRSWSSRPNGTFAAKYKWEILAKADACTGRARSASCCVSGSTSNVGCIHVALAFADLAGYTQPPKR